MILYGVSCNEYNVAGITKYHKIVKLTVLSSCNTFQIISNFTFHYACFTVLVRTRGTAPLSYLFKNLCFR